MFSPSLYDNPAIVRARRKRRRVGLILRLIDVIFILLFGFIVISEVERKSQIKLAESQTSAPDIPDKELVVFIGVLPTGEYLVENEEMLVENLKELEKYIRLKKLHFQALQTKMRIRIRASRDAAVKYAFPIVRICKEEHIPVGMDVIKKGRRSQP